MAKTKTSARKSAAHARKAPTRTAAKKTTKKYPKLALDPIKVKAKVVGTGKKARKVKPSKLGASQVMALLVEQTGLARKDVKLVVEALANTVKASIMPGAIGAVTVPGIGTIKTRHIEAKKVAGIKAGTMVRNPRTGEEKEHPGRKAYTKPATVKVRVVAGGELKRAALGTE